MSSIYTLEGLPTEIKLVILENLRDRESLQNLTKSSNSFRHINKSFKDSILTSVVWNELLDSGDLQKDIALLYNVQRTVDKSTSPERNALVLLSAVNSGNTTPYRLPASTSGKEFHDLKMTCVRNHLTVNYWLDNFFGDFMAFKHKLYAGSTRIPSATPSSSCPSFSSTSFPLPPTPDSPASATASEKAKVLSAIYRFWTFVILIKRTRYFHYLRMEDPGREDEQERGQGIMNQFDMFMANYTEDFWAYRNIIAVFDFFKWCMSGYAEYSLVSKLSMSQERVMSGQLDNWLMNYPSHLLLNLDFTTLATLHQMDSANSNKFLSKFNKARPFNESHDPDDNHIQVYFNVYDEMLESYYCKSTPARRIYRKPEMESDLSNVYFFFNAEVHPYVNEAIWDSKRLKGWGFHYPKGYDAANTCDTMLMELE